MNPKISIVMSAFNERIDYLEAAVGSVVAQTFEDWELILVDDGSDEAGARTFDQVVARLDDSRIRLIRHSNMGLTKSLNRAFSEARGKYFARLDSDDIALPQRLEIQARFLDSHPEVGLVGSDFFEIDSLGHRKREIRKEIDHDLIHARLLRDNHICHSAVMMRREAFEIAGGYDEAFVLAQDYDLWLKIALSGRFRLASIPDFLVELRRDGRTVSERRREEQMAFALRAREGHLTLLREANPSLWVESVLTAMVLHPEDDGLIKAWVEFGRGVAVEPVASLTGKMVCAWVRHNRRREVAKDSLEGSAAELDTFLDALGLKSIAPLSVMNLKDLVYDADRDVCSSIFFKGLSNPFFSAASQFQRVSREIGQGFKRFLKGPWTCLVDAIFPLGTEQWAVGILIAAAALHGRDARKVARCHGTWLAGIMSSLRSGRPFRPLPVGIGTRICSRASLHGLGLGIRIRLTLMLHNAKVACRLILIRKKSV